MEAYDHDGHQLEQRPLPWPGVKGSSLGVDSELITPVIGFGSAFREFWGVRVDIQHIKAQLPVASAKWAQRNSPVFVERRKRVTLT